MDNWPTEGKKLLSSIDIYSTHEIPFYILMNSVSFFPPKKIYEKIKWFFNKLVAKVKEMGGITTTKSMIENNKNHKKKLNGNEVK